MLFADVTSENASRQNNFSFKDDCQREGDDPRRNVVCKTNREGTQRLWDERSHI